MLRREVPSFLDTIGLLSPFCYRRIQDLPPQGMCFCASSESAVVKVPEDLQTAALKALGLAPARLRPNKVVIVARQNRRFILNQRELIRKARALGYDAAALPLERMTVKEQIEALRDTAVLFGVHGAGLMQSLWLPRGARVIQWIPQGIDVPAGSLSAWFSPVTTHVELVTRFGNRSIRSGWSALNISSTSTIGTDFYRYWINQDVIVPPASFLSLLERGNLE